MPIRINLMAEAQAAEESRRRDPVKRAIWIGAFLVAVVVIWIGKMQMDVMFESAKLKNLTGQWTAKEPQYKAITNYQARMQDVNRKLDALDRLSTNRFLWGNVLNALQQTVVTHIVVTHITGSQNYVIDEPHAIGTGSSKTLTRGAVTEKIKLSIDGRDYDSAAESYSKYKDILSNFDYFATHLQRRDGFVLDGALGPLTADTQDPAKQFQNFTLATHFPDTRRDD